MSPEEALARGWSIIPCGTDKRPLIAWRAFQERHPTEDELSAWEKKRPVAWAVITGAISGIVTLDFDGDAGAETLHKLGLEPHRRTGSGGFHVDFQHPGWRVATLNGKSKRELGEKWPGVDIRADGGYAIFTGRNGAGPYQNISDAQPYALDVLPEDLRKFLGLLQPPAASNGNARHAATQETQETRDKSEAQPAASTLLAYALEQARVEGRNNAGFSLAVQCRDHGFSKAEAEAVLREYAGNIGSTNIKGQNEPYRTEEALASVRSAYSSQARLTEFGLAELLVQQHGQELRYCHSSKNWFVFDGRHWTEDDTAEAERKAKAAVRSLFEDLATEQDKERRKEILSFAQRCESDATVRHLLKRAAAEPGIPVRLSDFDSDPYLLNVGNGVVNLRTGALRPHSRELLLHNFTRVEYHPSARSPVWHGFLYDLCDGNFDLMDFLQTAAGYSATGETSEEKLFMPIGPGGSGKTTFLEANKAALGSYAWAADFESFLQRPAGTGGIRNDIAELAGKRFVLSVEVDDGARLAAGLVKHLTGGDTMRARHLYQGGFQFQPQFKLWLAANHAPRARDDDSGLWRRILRIPLENVVPENRRDPTLKARLKDPGACGQALLAWIVEGAIRWSQEGLKIPKCVRAATEAYREAEDPLRDFFADCCVFAPDAWASAANLRSRYERHCEANGIKHPLGPQQFGERLRSRDVARTLRKINGKPARVWEGIRLLGVSR